LFIVPAVANQSEIDYFSIQQIRFAGWQDQENIDIQDRGALQADIYASADG
jgi:hypothetical protein